MCTALDSVEVMMVGVGRSGQVEIERLVLGQTRSAAKYKGVKVVPVCPNTAQTPL